MDETPQPPPDHPSLLSDPFGWAYRYTRKAIVLVIGFTLLLLGVVLIFTPGPAIVVIPLALSVLAIEFVWAARLLKRMKRVIKQQFSSQAAATPDAAQKSAEQRENPPHS